MCTTPLLGKEFHLYILSGHQSLADRYIIITPNLFLNGFDTMDQASWTQFRGPCQFSQSLSVLGQRGLTNIYSPVAISSCPKHLWCFMCDNISGWWAIILDVWGHRCPAGGCRWLKVSASFSVKWLTFQGIYCDSLLGWMSHAVVKVENHMLSVQQSFYCEYFKFVRFLCTFHFLVFIKLNF